MKGTLRRVAAVVFLPVSMLLIGVASLCLFLAALVAWPLQETRKPLREVVDDFLRSGPGWFL